MKSNIKRLLAAAAIFAFILAFVPMTGFSQSAQPYTTTLNGGTNNVLNAATNTYSITQVCGEFDHVGFVVSALGSGAGTGNVLFKFKRSYDNGVTYETVPSVVVTHVLNGAAQVVTCADITIYNDTHLKLSSIENTNSIYITNVIAKFGLKSPKRGAFQAYQ